MLTIEKVLNEKNMDRNICVYGEKKYPKKNFNILSLNWCVVCFTDVCNLYFASHSPFFRNPIAHAYTAASIFGGCCCCIFLQILYLVRVCVLAYTVVTNRLIHCAIVLFPSYDISTFVWRDFASVNASFRCFFLIIFLFFYLIFFCPFRIGSKPVNWIKKKSTNFINVFVVLCRFG